MLKILQKRELQKLLKTKVRIKLHNLVFYVLLFLSLYHPISSLIHIRSVPCLHSLYQRQEKTLKNNDKKNDKKNYYQEIKIEEN